MNFIMLYRTRTRASNKSSDYQIRFSTGLLGGNFMNYFSSRVFQLNHSSDERLVEYEGTFSSQKQRKLHVNIDTSSELFLFLNKNIFIYLFNPQPENLLCAQPCSDTLVKLCDFGLAIITADDQPRHHGMCYIQLMNHTTISETRFQ